MPIVTGLNANVFRAVSGSLFSSPVNWSRGVVPTGSDVAMIGDNCVIDISRTIGTLVVRPGFTASINTGLTLRVNDVINVMGHLSCSGAPNIISFAGKNIINSLSPGTSTFTYIASSAQSVAGANYNILRINGAGNKTLNGNLIVSGNLFFDTAASLDLFSYDMSVSGLTNLGGSLTTYRLIKSKPGNVLFGGGTSQETFGNARAIDFSGGNPNVEVRNGLVITEYVASPTNILPGYGTWTFSTNNQNLSCLINFLGDVLVSGSINLNLQSSNVSLYKPINGTTGSASLTNRGTIQYYTANAGNNMMRTGSFDYLTHLNTQNYVINGPYTLPYTTYRNLGIGNPSAGGSTGTMFLSGSTIVSGSLTVVSGHFLDCSSSSLEVTGSTYVQAGGTIFKSSNVGRAIFGGNFRGDFFGGQVAIDFSASNASAEFRNGIYTFYYQGNTVTFRTGTGSWFFTTNNQAINSNIGSGNASFTTTYDCPIIISGAITLDITNTNLYFNNTINGTEAASKFKNSSVIYFASSQSLGGSFRTGSYDFTSSVNTVYFGGDYSGTSSVALNTFYNLGITGTGVKTLGTSSYVSGALNVNGTFDIGSSNLIVSGASYVNSTTSQIRKSGPGKVTFIGQLTYNGSSFPSSFIDFSGGNPIVELNKGISTVNTNVFNSGTGSWYFLSSSQKIEANAGGSSTLNFYGPMIIGSGVTLTIDSYGPININRQTIVLNNAAGINGMDSTSTLINYGTIIVSASAAIMTTGSFTASFATASTINYNFSGSLKLPYTSYANLAVSTGSVTLTGSTSVTGSLTVGGGTIFDLQSYNLIVSGSTTLSANSNPVYPFQKTQSGSITFVGPVFFGGPGGNAYIADFSLGNPDLEFRNSISASNYGGAIVKPGSGSVYFTTNNQGIFNSGGSAGFIFSGSIKIGSGITVTLRGVGAGLTSLETVREIDGTDANSKFIIGTVATGAPTVYYNSPLEPMRTGSMDVSSSAAATFIYNSGSQNVKGGTYRNLTFLNGLKTLQGNVSVLGTFSTGSGATSGSYNLNGFTLTNP